MVKGEAGQGKNDKILNYEYIDKNFENVICYIQRCVRIKLNTN